PDAVPPPRADLSAPWAVEERDGWVWVANDRTVHHRPPRAVPGTTADPVPALPAPAGPVLTNVEAALARAWHPVARVDQLGEGGWLAVRLLGSTWTLQRRGGVVTADPVAGVRERDGALWLAPGSPVTTDLPAEAFPGRTQWLPAVRTATPAAVLLDAVLNPGTPGVVPAVTPVGGGCTARWADAGGQVVVHLRAPFQLRRDEVLPDGSTRSLLLLLQPEDADSTLVHARVALGGRAGRVQLAAEADRVRDVLAALDRPLPGAGLPLTPRDEVHLPGDRLGVAYRHALADLLVSAREADRTEEDDDVAAA
ncbi:(2Fe-2S)-binding protein, partial [Klenkia sp. PcliD-1-E]|uniref:(2Fe-2S)-binding protein n=1 Tax=Klenkia sp. PcliD-1-E TaxID=2954492 RepID=UPI0020979355